LHENFKIAEEILNITDYISYMTKVKLLELKRIAPRADIDGISVKFSTRYKKRLGCYDTRNHEFTYNIKWIEEHMNHPDFKKELDEIISHETAHVIFPNHGRYWKLMCRALGGTGETRYNNQQFICKGKYVAICPNCDHRWYSDRKARGGYCGICSKRGIKALVEFKLCDEIEEIKNEERYRMVKQLRNYINKNNTHCKTNHPKK
jgi:hypothetical protein